MIFIVDNEYDLKNLIFLRYEKNDWKRQIGYLSILRENSSISFLNSSKKKVDFRPYFTRSGPNHQSKNVIRDLSQNFFLV